MGIIVSVCHRKMINTNELFPSERKSRETNERLWGGVVFFRIECVDSSMI